MKDAENPPALDELRALLRAGRFVAARTLLRALAPADLLAAWGSLTRDERAGALRLSPRANAARVFEELPVERQAELALGLERRAAQELLGALDPSHAARLLRALRPEDGRRLLAVMRRDDAELARGFLDYAPGSLGALMRARWLAVEEDASAAQALARARARAKPRPVPESRLDALLVLGPRGAIRGIVGLEALESAAPQAPVSRLMSPVETFSLDSDPREAFDAFLERGLRVAPVLSEDGELAGVLAARDLVPLAREHARRSARAMAAWAAAAAAAACAFLLALSRCAR